MLDQEVKLSQESVEQSTSVLDFIPGKPSLNEQFSLLHLNQRPMASNDIVSDHTAGPDVEQYKIAPSPIRSPCGNTTPLKRRSSSSSFSPMPESSDSDAVYRRLLSEGFRVFPLPTAGNEIINSSPLIRTTSLNSTGSSSISQAEIPNRGNLAIPESLARRSLFPLAANGQSSAAHMLPPLPRTSSDPLQFSKLENPMSTTRERNPGSRTDSYASCGVHGNGSGLGSIQQSSPCKRLKSKIHNRTMKQQIMKWIDQMPEGDDDDDEQINNVSIPKTEIIPINQKAVVDGHDNNWGYSAVQKTIAKAESEGPQEKLTDNESKEEDALEAEADLVTASREGDCTYLEFKCRCGSSYSVGIIGGSCFYKLV